MLHDDLRTNTIYDGWATENRLLSSSNYRIQYRESLNFHFTLPIISMEKKHDGKASTSGRNITSLRFADDMDALSEEEQELEVLVEVSTKTAQGIRWRSVLRRQTKLMTNSANGIRKEISVKGQKLGTVTSFKYLKQLSQTMVQIRRFSKDCTSHWSSYKAKANLDR